MFAERFRIRRNWRKGYCNVRTFEGHTQGMYIPTSIFIILSHFLTVQVYHAYSLTTPELLVARGTKPSR